MPKAIKTQGLTKSNVDKKLFNITKQPLKLTNEESTKFIIIIIIIIPEASYLEKVQFQVPC